MRRREFLRRSAVVATPLFLEGCGLSMPAMQLPRIGEQASRPEDPWLQHFAVDSRGLSRVLGTLGSNGGDFGEIYFQECRSSSLRWHSRAVLTRRTDYVSGAGLRVVSGGRSSFRHTVDLDTGSLDAVAQAAAGERSAGISVAAREDGLRFQQPGSAYARQPTSVNDAIPNEQPREAVAHRLDSLIRSAEPGLDDVDINLTVSDEWVLIATLDGRLVADRRPMLRLSAQALMTRGGDTQSGFAALSVRQTLDELEAEPNGAGRLEALAQTVVERTARLFDARRPPEGDMPVMLSAGTGGVLLREAVAQAFESDLVRQGRSALEPGTAAPVASEAVTLVDDATVPNQRGSLNVDDEGEPGQRTVLVDRGRLASLVYDRRDALAAGVAPTGNGRRMSCRYEPMPRASCTYIENGNESPDALLESIGRGIIAETFVGGDVEPGGGRFRFRVKHGWYVEGGRRSVPVRDFELSGQGLALLKSITRVANDRQFDTAGWTSKKNGQSLPVSQGRPSVLVSSLAVKPLS